jgi:hypothetical protein
VCFILSLPNIICLSNISGKTGAYQSGATKQSHKLEGLHKRSRLGQKCLPESNALAYYAKVQTTLQKVLLH